MFVSQIIQHCTVRNCVFLTALFPACDVKPWLEVNHYLPEINTYFLLSGVPFKHRCSICRTNKPVKWPDQSESSVLRTSLSQFTSNFHLWVARDPADSLFSWDKVDNGTFLGVDAQDAECIRVTELWDGVEDTDEALVRRGDDDSLWDDSGDDFKSALAETDELSPDMEGKSDVGRSNEPENLWYILCWDFLSPFWDSSHDNSCLKNTAFLISSWMFRKFSLLLCIDFTAWIEYSRS